MEEKIWQEILPKLPRESLEELDKLSDEEMSEEKIREILEKSGLDFNEIIKSKMGE